MKKYFLLLMWFALGSNVAFSQELKDIAEPVFKTGEQLSYKFKYGFITGAEGTLHVEDGEKIDGHPTYHIIADGKTAGTFDFFYKVRNRYESYVDRNTLLPYLYIENRKEGSWKHTDKVKFSQSEGKIVANKGTFLTKGKTFDFVSAYYFARGLDISKIKIGDKFELPYFLDDGVLRIKVIGRR